MSDPVLLTVSEILRLHALQRGRFGGGDGLRDRGLLESAVGRALNLFAYDPGADVHLGAATLGHSILKNHALVDGNKRAAFAAIYVTLALNGFRLEADPIETASRIVDMATSRTSAEEAAAWLRARCVPDPRFAIARGESTTGLDPAP